MIVLNFAHPLTEAQRAALEALTGEAVARVVDAPAHFAEEQGFGAQAAALVAKVGLSPEQWQQESLLVSLPSLNVIAALVLAELHGRMGYFPAVVRLRRVAESLPPRFEVAEIVDLQGARERARRTR